MPSVSANGKSAPIPPTINQATRFDQIDKRIHKRIVGGLVQWLMERHPDFKDQFLKFIYAELLALKTIQSLQFFGRRNVFQHFDTLILRRAAGVMG